MLNNLLVTKKNGQLVPYDPNKSIASMERTGVDQKTIKEVMRVVRTKIVPKMKTSAIHDLIIKELSNQKPWAAARYDLREAITKLGPAGYNFEKYVASILDAYGYDATNPEELQGACVTHEVDVMAKKDGRIAFIEAKFRHDNRATIGIKDTMSTWARFLDLVDGSKVGLCPHFDEAWLVTNARFTDQSLKYGHCKNMVLIGWNHPKERSFAKMVDLDALYPVTIIKELKPDELERFAKADIMLCRELNGISTDDLRAKTGISEQRLDVILSACEGIVKGDKA
ncbi:hypothetical protein HOI18_03360 [Candidatus Uhrbacteria bacterium]|mgnify:CR=1 FL=1|jgi:hypothetical protein|nr:hypothetical protein [Candidatus Uhrbacteria bacterium]